MHRYTYAKCQRGWQERIAETVHGTTTLTTTTTARTSIDIDLFHASVPRIVRAERAIVLLLVPDVSRLVILHHQLVKCEKEWEQKASSTVF